MPFLRVPTEHQPALAKIAQLSDEVVEQLHTALSTAAQRVEGGQLSADDLLPIPSGIERADLQKIIEAIISLNFGRTYSDSDVEEFAADISQSMQAAAPSVLSTPDAIDRFKKRIQQFLTIGAIARSAKTDILRYEHERSVHTLRILTDIRPIFGNNPAEPPEAVVITHTLKIAYHHSGRLEEVFFGMDEDDIRQLKEAVERAEEKAKTIRTTLAKAKLNVVTEEQE